MLSVADADRIIRDPGHANNIIKKENPRKKKNKTAQKKEKKALRKFVRHKTRPANLFILVCITYDVYSSPEYSSAPST